MAAIAPNSDVYICKGVPLDIGYEHTIYVPDKTAQYNIIHSYTKYSLNNQSYQRVARDYIRVGYCADDLQDCNYMMFRNTSYGSKWFYAFITDILYLNDNTSQIKYELDVMQSYYFDYDLGQCFVEREHTLTDYLYESQTDEGLNPGDMIVRSMESKYFDSVESSYAKYYAVIYYVPNDQYFQPKVYTQSTSLEPTPLGALSKYNVYNYIPTMTFTLAVPVWCSENTAQDFTTTALPHAVDKLTEIEATIVTIQMIPAEIAQAYGLLSGDNNTNSGDQVGFSYIFSLDEGSSFADIHDNVVYTPKNKKLLQYPYTYITLSNNTGESTDYKWELFDHTFNTLPHASFRMIGAVNPDVQVHCYPYEYRKAGANGSQEIGLTIQDFPRLSWSADSFQEWWNVNKNSFSLSMITKILGTAAAAAGTVATGNPLLGSAAVSGVGAIAQSLAGVADQKATPDTQRGSTSGSGILMRERRMGFTLYDMCITGERAKIIDDFFTMYGYAIKRLKTVNVRTAAANILRPHWNYIKTSNVVVHGNNMNAEAERKIESIYNKGITFWMNAANVGNYSLDNSPRV